MLKQKKIMLIATCFAVALFVLSLPSILTMPWLVRAKLADLDPDFSQQAKVGSCSIGWFQGLNCRDLSYRHPDWDIHLQAAGLRSNKGLLALLFGPSYLGDLHIEQPVLTLFSLPDFRRPERAPGDLSNEELEKRRQGETWWERLSFGFIVNKGTILLAQGDHPPLTLASDVSIHKGSLALGRVQYEGSFRAGLEQKNLLQTQGFVNLPTATQSIFDDLVSHTELTVQGMDIQPYLDQIATGEAVLRGQGIMDGQYRIATSGFENVDIEGNATVREAHFSGVFFETSPFQINRAMLRFKGNYRGSLGWQLNALTLDSDPLRLTANGHYYEKTAQLTTQGTVYISDLLASVPTLLGPDWQELTQDGMAHFSLSATKKNDNWLVKLDGQTEGLLFGRNNALFSEEQPLFLQAELEQRQGQIIIPNVHLNAPFLDLQGNGNLEAFTFQAMADIAETSAEFRTLFPPGLSAQGQMNLHGVSSRLPNGEYQVQAQANFADLTLLQGDTPFLVPQDSFLNVDLRLPFAASPQNKKTGTIRIDGEFHPGRFLIESDELAIQQGYLHAPYHLAVDLDMKQLDRLLNGLGLKKAETFLMEGLLNAEGRGEWNKDHISLFSFEGKVVQAMLRLGKMNWQEPELRFSLAGRAPAVDEKMLQIQKMHEVEVWDDFFSLAEAVHAAEPGSDARPESPSGDANWRDVLSGKVSEAVEPLQIRDLLIRGSWGDFLSKRQIAFLLDPSEDIWELRHLHLIGPQFSINGSISSLGPLSGNLVVDLHANSTASLLGQMLRNAGWLGQDLDLRGPAQLRFQTRPEEEGGRRHNLALHVEPFGLLEKEREIFTDRSVSLDASLIHDQGKPGLRIDAASFLSGPLAFEGTGLLTGDDMTFMTLQGNMQPDPNFFIPLLPSPLNQMRMTWGAEAPFLFAGPLDDLGTLRRISLSTVLPVESLHYRGVSLQDVEIPLELARGDVKMRIDAPFQGGALSLGVSCQLDEAQPHLIISPGSVVLNEVEMSPGLMEGLLQPLHPLFGILTQPKGKFSLQVEKFSWPLGNSKRKDSGFTVAVDTIGLKWPARAELQDLLQLLGLEKSALRLDNRRLACSTGAKGINCGNLKIWAGREHMLLTGTMTADDKLSYRLEVPITKHLTEKLKLPYMPELAAVANIGGTRKKPVLYRQAMLDDLTAYLYKHAPQEEKSDGLEVILEENMGMDSAPDLPKEKLPKRNVPLLGENKIAPPLSAPVVPGPLPGPVTPPQADVHTKNAEKETI